MLNVNSIIEWPGYEESSSRMERILWIDASRKEVVTIELYKNKPFPQWKELIDIEKALENGEAVQHKVDPFWYLSMPKLDISKKNREHRDRSWELIKDIVKSEPEIYRSEGRGTLLHQLSKKHGVHVMTIYKNLRKYWVGGKIKNALLPMFDKCGAPGKLRKCIDGKKRGRPAKILKLYPEQKGINVDDEIRRIFISAVRLYYNKRDKVPLKHAYDLMIQHFFIQGFRMDGDTKVPVLLPAFERPTYGQFRYWFIKELDLRKTIISREGKREFNLRKRAVLGSSTQMAYGPGSIYQIDATIGDVYLVSRYDRTLIIGRPVIYLVIDVFSRMIVGIYIGLTGPNWVGAMMALANATIDKVGFCSEYGIENTHEQWPCSYLPDTILADRGEIAGINADYIVDTLNISVANTPPYRADMKGIVEQHFRRANLKVIHWLPGAVKERLRKPGQKDHRLDATLDLFQFTKIMIEMVLDYNLNHWMKWYSRDEFVIKDHVNPIPIDLWKWGIKNRSGHLREKSPEAIILNLMPRGVATVTFEGIRFEGMYYSCLRAVEEQWFEKARNYGNWNITIAHDPRKTDYIYLLLNEGKEVEVCQLKESEKRYKGYRLEEVKDLLELESIEGQVHMASSGMQAKADFNAKVNTIVKEAKKQTKIALDCKKKSNRQRLNGIRQNRAQEAKRLDSEKAWDVNKVQGSDAGTVNGRNTSNLEDIQAKAENSPYVDKKKSMLRLLKNQSD